MKPQGVKFLCAEPLLLLLGSSGAPGDPRDAAALPPPSSVVGAAL